MKKIILVIFAISLISCARPLSWDVETRSNGPFTYGPPTNVVFQLSSNRMGTDAVHTLTFDIKEGDLETYQAVITYPSEFIFQGFLAVGPPGTQIGSYSVDFDFDGFIDFTIPVFSRDNNNAYADRDLSGTFNSPIDSTLVYSNSNGNHVFTTTLPFGGDGFAQSITGPFTERIVAVINSGIIKNPFMNGTFTATGTFTSVDPDTDGQNNNTGDQPKVVNFNQQLVIVSSDIPLPNKKEAFPAYSPIVSPFVNTNPSQAKPAGIGSKAQGGNILSIKIAYSQFNSAVDIYGAFTISASPDRVSVLNPDGKTFQTFTTNQILNTLRTGTPPSGAKPYLKNITGSVSAHLFDISVDAIPKGTYMVYLLVTPAGNLSQHYLWTTSFVVT
ncbi:hypothetical protein EP227_07635 [bacterium]|nr:MAG: hypothetical protein EP227_07635 [bacterium]